MKTAVWMALTLVSLSVSGCGLFNSAEKQRAAAEAALEDGNYGEAAVTLRNLLEEDAQDIELRMLLARALHMQGDSDGAQRTLQAAIERGAAAEQVAELQIRWALANGDYQAALDAAADPASPLTDEQRKYFRARGLQGVQRVPEALALLRELAQSRPESADLQLRIAQSHAHLGRLASAQAAVERALELSPAEGEQPVEAESWMLKGTLAEQADDRRAVREAYKQAAAVAAGELTAPQQGQLLSAAVDESLQAGDLAAAREYRAQLASALPQSALARLSGAQVRLHEEGDPAEAIAELQRLLQEQQNVPAVRLMLAAGQLRAGAMEQALNEVNTLASASGSAEIRSVQEVVRAASAAAPASAERALSSAAALVALRQPGMARMVLEQAQSQHPDDQALLRARVQVELRSGRPEEALKLAQDMVNKNPEQPLALAILAETQAANQDHAAAAQTYEQVWKTSANAPVALAYAQVRRRAGLDDPERPLREWLERQPRDASVRLSLATALQQAGRNEEAAREFQRVLAALPADNSMRAIAQNNLALVYAETGDRRALETAKAAYEMAGAVPAIQDTYGWLLVRSGKAAEGLPLLESAATALPASASIRYHYAHALAATGDKDKAGILLADLLQSDEPFEGREEAEKLHATL